MVDSKENDKFDLGVKRVNSGVTFDRVVRSSVEKSPGKDSCR